jgi:hypothetical protein
MKPYYYVFKSSGHPPSKRHESVYEAQKESLRLSALHPGQAFEILMCIGITQTVNEAEKMLWGMDWSNRYAFNDNLANTLKGRTVNPQHSGWTGLNQLEP